MSDLAQTAKERSDAAWVLLSRWENIAMNGGERWLRDHRLVYETTKLLGQEALAAPRCSEEVQTPTGRLLPCPFCGVVPLERFEKNPNGPKYPDHWFVWCENLDCKAGGESMEETQAEARAAWNTRVPPQRCSEGRGGGRMNCSISPIRSDTRAG
jgi:hypothetical protein